MKLKVTFEKKDMITFGIFAVILFDSGIWKALSFLLMMIAAVAFGYKNF